MAVLTLLTSANTSSLSLPADTYTSLIGGAQTVTGTGGLVTIIGYAYELDFSEVSLRIVVDGTELVSVAQPDIMINKTLSIGSHTIDLQAISLNTTRTATTRGLTAFTL